MTDLFGSDNPNQLDDKKSYLDELLGPGGKFDATKYASREAALEALARGKMEADSYIPNLLSKMDEMRTDLTQLRSDANARPGLDEVLAQIAARRNEPNDNRPNPDANDGNRTPAIDPNQIRELARAEYKAEQLRQAAESNFAKVQSKLQEKFGPNFAAELNAKARALGLDQNTVNNLAQTSPDAFFNMFGLNDASKPTNTAPPRSSLNASFTPATPEKRTWAWYQELRKKDPEAYYSPKWTMQRIDDSATLGKEFQDGDWDS